MPSRSETENAAPERLRMSYAEFLAWSHEDVHAEWIDGEVIIHMPPKDRHQRLVEFLERLLALFIEVLDMGIVRVAPFEMRLREGDPAYEPDIMVLQRAHLSRLSEDRLDGPADLIIEIISASSVQHDRDTKWRAYRDGGVSEYWIIDSRPNRQRADFYRRNEQGEYILVATEDDERVFSSVLPGFWFKPAWLWAEPLPTPLAALYEMAGVSRDLIAHMQAALQQGLRQDEIAPEA